MQVSQHCYAVTGLAYTAPWSLNAGFIVGDETTLIVDTSATALSAATIYGYATVVRPQNRLMVINTEQHFDHIGGNGYFREKGIDVYGHRAMARTEAEFREEMDDFNRQIPNRVRREQREAQVFYSGTKLTCPNQAIDSDTALQLGNLEVQVLLTPGHTPSNLAVYVPSDSVLFSGDCLVNGYLPNLEAGSVPAWRQWLGSLTRVENLAPQTVIPGHGPVVDKGRVPAGIQQIRSVLQQAIAAGRPPTSELSEN